MKYSVLLLVLCANLGEWKSILVTCKIITTELCGSHSTIELAPDGEASSVTINLNPMNYKRACKLNITAPPSYVVNLQWHEEQKELLDNHSTDTSPCPLSIFLPEDNKTPVWKGDPCTKSSLPEVDLLTPELSLFWYPPRFRVHTKGRKLVVTAVAQGDICRKEGQHTCMRIGWKPVLCISELLVCDGNPNCPKGASTSDEDEVLCKSHLAVHGSWQDLAEDIMKKLPAGIMKNNVLDKQDNPELNAVTNVPQLNFINWKQIKNNFDIVLTTSQPTNIEHHDSSDSVSAALAHYGPWGYLMLAMLICGTVLMFCGLWECCFRKPKPHIDLQNRQEPPTVLIINRHHDDGLTTQPPNYDELDQPPSYTTLFPHVKIEAVTEDITLNSEHHRIINEIDSVQNTSENNEREQNEEIICQETVRSDNAINICELRTTRGRHSPNICIVTNL